jgi:hypothetical protein
MDAAAPQSVATQTEVFSISAHPSSAVGVECNLAIPSRGRFETRGFRLLVGSLCAVGVATRLAPILDGSTRLLRQFPTEDGYLMMTIARSIALGRGMTTAEGAIASNGTQPAFNLVEALCFWLVGGDRPMGVFAIELVQFFVAAAAAWVLYLLGRRILADRPWGAQASALAAAAWYASNHVVPHTMNCLETGWYVLMVLLSVLQWHGLWQASQSTHAPLWRQALLAGLMLGLTFWARIDAVFLIGALTVVHAGWAYRGGWARLRPRLIESTVAGSVALAIASPWLLYGKLRFGSFMPVSGMAESASRWFTNTALLPASLFRYITLVVPVPHEYNTRLPVILACSAVVLLWAGLVVTVARRAVAVERWLLLSGLLLFLGLATYYGLAFGAGHFLDRYLFPASPFLALLNVAILISVTRNLHSRWWMQAGRVAMAALLLLVVGVDARAYRQGRQHMHFQVVDWVERNLADTTWVAAIQTGTLGFFHDRTVNLDGKVNPEALALQKMNRIPDYVVNSRWGKAQGTIDYLVDWNGITEWRALAPVRANFDLILDDPRANLAVFRRKSAAAYSLR